MAVNFWNDLPQWPDDMPGQVFLGRAVRAIGRALYPDTWSDISPGIEPPDSGWLGAEGSDIQALLDASRQRPAPSVETALNRRHRRQAHQVLRTIARHARAARLRTYARSKDTGILQPLDPGYWSEVAPDEILRECRTGRGERIFVDRTQLLEIQIEEAKAAAEARAQAEADGTFSALLLPDLSTLGEEVPLPIHEATIPPPEKRGDAETIQKIEALVPPIWRRGEFPSFEKIGEMIGKPREKPDTKQVERCTRYVAHRHHFLAQVTARGTRAGTTKKKA